MFQSTLPRGERLARCRSRPCRLDCFNPRSRVGSDAALVRSSAPRLEVSIHAPAWGATSASAASISSASEFQSTLPRGERRRPIVLILECAVSIHAPAWGATSCRALGQSRSRFQSTLPRGERQLDAALRRRSSAVSIHAPAWGATGRPDRTVPSPTVSIHAPAWGATGAAVSRRAQLDVSIHAPAWGATGMPMSRPRLIRSFNPRSRVGSDARRASGDPTCCDVSIHAPAWGATSRLAASGRRSAFQSTLPRGERPHADRSPAWPRQFQSTLPRGERPTPAILHRAQHRSFQSTLPRGERPTASQCVTPISFNPRSRVGSDASARRHALSSVPCFNPRSRVGSDTRSRRVQPSIRVSIHAPAWGATQTARHEADRRSSFNPRSRVGSDAVHASCRRLTKCFNPRSRVGSDVSRAVRSIRDRVSIHAPAWGATSSSRRHASPRVSIHAPAWGATL